MTDHYGWGAYDFSVYKVARAEPFEVGEELRHLIRQRDKLERTGKPAPPGFHAHLGYVFFVAGDVRAAEGELRAEKAAFPESARFVDWMLDRIERSTEREGSPVAETGERGSRGAYEPNRPPRSILVLPPVNETFAMEATAVYLSAVSSPLGERGYYVFPVAVVDRILRENGLFDPVEMHAVPLERLAPVFGADAVLYVKILEWPNPSQLDEDFLIEAVLVDGGDGTVLWSGVMDENAPYPQQHPFWVSHIAWDYEGRIARIFAVPTSYYRAWIASGHLAFCPKCGLPPGPYQPGDPSAPSGAVIAEPDAS